MKDKKAKWRLIIEDKPLAPEVNMANDEAILDLQESLGSLPTLRLYMWDRPTLTLGYFQKAAKEIQLDKVLLAGRAAIIEEDLQNKKLEGSREDSENKDGMPVGCLREKHVIVEENQEEKSGLNNKNSNEKITLVRRITGGRSVLHHNELTYSIIIPDSYSGLPAGVTESYRYLSQGLLATLDILGIESQLQARHNKEEDKRTNKEEKIKASSYSANNMGEAIIEGNMETDELNRFKSAACFDTPSYYELLVQGKKIIGSAQVRRGATILQHGSIPLASNIEELFSVLAFPSDRVRERLQAKFASSAIAINEISDRNYSIDEIRNALILGFGQALDIDLIPGQLEPAETELANRLVREKFANDDWTLRK